MTRRLSPVLPLSALPPSALSPSALPPPAVGWPVAITLLSASLSASLLATPAFAQGTAEQREACTEDAIRLCSDAIPDVGRTTLCMKAHGTQLSPRCHRVVFAGEPETRAPRVEEPPRRIVRAPRAAEDDRDAPRPRRGYLAPRRAAPGPEDGILERRRATRDEAYGYDDAYGYREPSRVAPDERYGFDEPRRFEPGPDEDFYDRPRRAERVGPDPYDDGYGPRRYLYSTPQGLAETPY